MNIHAQQTALQTEEQFSPLYDAREPILNEFGRRRRLRRIGHDPDVLVHRAQEKQTEQ